MSTSTNTTGARHTILVTGASGGVGEGIAVAAGQRGWEVWIAARRPDEGRRVAARVDAAGGSGRFVACDVGDPVSVAAVMDEVRVTSDRLDGVVHNATSGASSRSGHVDDIPFDDLEDQVAVSLRGTYLIALAVLPLLEETSGSYLVMTSEAGFEGKRLLAAYAMVKAAQRGLARSLAREWGPHGVRVNTLAPLALSPAMGRAFESDPEMERRVMGRNPLGHLGDPVDDIGAVACFLLGADARFVTGQTVMADGGSCPIT